MKPIVLRRSLSESIWIEQDPVGYGVTPTYRGAEIIPTAAFDDKRASQDPSVHPYRARMTKTTQSLSPVIVRMQQSFDATYLVHWEVIFQQVSLARARMQAAGAPRILHCLGRGGTLLATVEEYLMGVSVRSILHELRVRKERISEPLALAVGAALVRLWQHAIQHDVHIVIEFEKVLINDQGLIRIRPKYRDEESRQEVGAAVLALNQHAASASPEEIRGELPNARSPMFVLGLLLYELLAGTHPFAEPNGTLFATISSIANKPAPFLHTKRPDVHPVVASFVHRCLARDPQARFADWDALRIAYTGMQSLFAPVLPEQLADFARRMVREDQRLTLPNAVFSDEPSELQEPLLDALNLDHLMARPTTIRQPMDLAKPDVDPDAEYMGRDSRPMLRVSPTLWVDARPVTRAEVERYLFATRQALPEVFRASNMVNDDDPCVLITPEIAEAYAAWAGKRLPTEAEWELAATTLGSERLDLGRVWEWTTTTYERGGRIVRGGRWRDQPTISPRLENRSFETNHAPDVGFRCVISSWGEETLARNGT